jgi:hypothetical protein
MKSHENPMVDDENLWFPPDFDPLLTALRCPVGSPSMSHCPGKITDFTRISPSKIRVSPRKFRDRSKKIQLFI